MRRPADWSCDPDDLDWAPLELFVASPTAVAARVDAADFMWMGTSSTLTPQRVHLYKHRDTRRYLYLADDGVSFFYRGDALVESGSVLESLVALGWFA